MRILALGACAIAACSAADRAAQAPPPVAPLAPVPSERQLRWQELEFYAFVHFNMNTFTAHEWGEGTEDPTRFNPTSFDARQWASTFRS